MLAMTRAYILSSPEQRAIAYYHENRVPADIDVKQMRVRRRGQ